MLLEFSVENYLSFKDIVTISLVASKIKEYEESNTLSFGKIKILKNAVIYGANASGKSNLFKAMSFMRRFVHNSSKQTQVTEAIDIDTFKLSTETNNAPSHFEIVFINEGILYRYGFEVDHVKIHKEWLFYAPKGVDVTLFTRIGSKIKLGSAFKEGKHLENKTRENALFLSVAAQFNGTIAIKLLKWFNNFNIISGLKDYKAFTLKQLQDPSIKPLILDFLKIADLDIEEIYSETISVTKEGLPSEMPDSLKNLLLNQEFKTVNTHTQHKKYDENQHFVEMETFNLDEQESEGTKKLFSLAGPIFDTLNNGGALIVDELDAKLHPLITRFIIGLFYSQSTNKHNAQLIFATHDISILSNKFFRRDQVWFTNKDKYGCTTLSSLVEYKEKETKIRNDASYGKDYILGKYGAIPYVGDIEKLFPEKEEVEIIECKNKE